MAKPLPSKKKALATRQLLGEAMQLHRIGQLAQAEARYLQVLDANPRLPEAQHLLGVLRGQQGRLDEALTLIGAASEAQPQAVGMLSDKGLIFYRMGRHDEALASFERALAIKADHVPALSNRGNTLAACGRLNDALASYESALRVRPDHPEALYNRGKVLVALGRPKDALTSLDRAIAINPQHADAHFGRGNALAALRRYDEALASYDRALAIASGHVEAFDNRGNALMQLRRHEAALASYARALAIRPNYAGALNNQGIALKELGRHQEALASFEAALAISPDFVDALYNRANTLKELRRYDEALAAYRHARLTRPDHPDAFGIVDVAASLCDWDEAERLTVELARHIVETPGFIGPLTWLALCDDPGSHLRCAQNYVADKIPLCPPPLWDGTIRRDGRIRIAYLSADFHEHATAYLIAELIELHDRARFEVLGVSFGRDDAGAMRRRLVAAFDQFHDVRSRSDREVAGLLHDLGVDVAVDLKGYTQESRPEILAFRPAPVQVSYLGYPGTMAAEFIDYILADRTVLPSEQQSFYTEKIVHLPDCYQVNDRARTVAEQAPTRDEAGLPNEGFVFCCFNNNFKITRAVFAVWMRLLQSVPASVLWLLRDNAGAERNLRQAARAHGVDESRLVFADRVPIGAHLARHRLADLVLDTLPYNAHTTASDALWCGVPVVTCQGRAFAGRVASSLLRAVGLPELVTATLADYETLARRLALDPSALAAVRHTLAANRMIAPLFDTQRFCRSLESAYARMLDIRERSGGVQAFAVER